MDISVCLTMRMSDGDLALMPGTVAANSAIEAPPALTPSCQRLAHCASAVRTSPRGRPRGLEAPPGRFTGYLDRRLTSCANRRLKFSAMLFAIAACTLSLA